MTRDQWERLKALFHGALEQPANTRTAWLTREAGGDAVLAREAAALVAAHDAAGGFLETPVLVDPADVAAPESLEPGTRIGSYEIEREVGRGGMGIVYLARDLRLDRRVALKALPPLHDGDEARRERLKREARAAATISHSAVATVYALEEIDGRLFIASEFVEGHTLRSDIDRGPLEPARALAVAADIARALCAAHAAGVVHRDLKPENVLITPGGSVKVVDFGIAHVEGATTTRLTRPGAAIGTPAYMAPEQLLGVATDARVDIYTFGILLAEMLTGFHPLAPGHVPAPMPASEVALRCIKTDPNERFQSARELLAALEREIARPSTRAGSGDTRATHRQSARWWWEFHQGTTAVVYGLMTWPAWLARGLIGGQWGDALFVTVLTAAIINAIMRLHLWFVSRSYSDELRWARDRAAPWITVADWVFVGTLVIGGVLTGNARPALALVQIAVGIGAAVAFLLIEPATARAAFGDRDQD